MSADMKEREQQERDEWARIHGEQLNRRGLYGRRKQKCLSCGRPITGWSCNCGMVFDD